MCRRLAGVTLICTMSVASLSTAVWAQDVDGVWQAWLDVQSKVYYSSNAIDNAKRATTDQARCENIHVAYKLQKDAANNMSTIVNDTRARDSGNMGTYQGGKAAIEKMRDDTEHLLKTFCVPLGY